MFKRLSVLVSCVCAAFVLPNCNASDVITVAAPYVLQALECVPVN